MKSHKPQAPKAKEEGGDGSNLRIQGSETDSFFLVFENSTEGNTIKATADI